MHFGSCESKPFIVEAGELIKKRYNFKSPLSEFWVKAMEAFTDMTNMLKYLALLRAYYDVISFLCHMTCHAQFDSTHWIRNVDLQQSIEL